MTGLVFMQVIQEYERAVIFRLGRVIKGRAKGPGTVQIISMYNYFLDITVVTGPIKYF